METFFAFGRRPLFILFFKDHSCHCVNGRSPIWSPLRARRRPLCFGFEWVDHCEFHDFFPEKADS